MTVEAFLFFALAAIYCAISLPTPSGGRRRFSHKDQKQPCVIDRVRTARQRYFNLVRKEDDGHNVPGRLQRR
jgi:hypothetical protein